LSTAAAPQVIQRNHALSAAQPYGEFERLHPSLYNSPTKGI